MKKIIRGRKNVTETATRIGAYSLGNYGNCLKEAVFPMTDEEVKSWIKTHPL